MGEESVGFLKSVELLKEEKTNDLLKSDEFLMGEKSDDLLKSVELLKEEKTNDLLNGKNTNEPLLKGETHALFNVLSYYCKSNDPAALRLLSRSLTPSLTAVLLQCARAYC